MLSRRQVIQAAGAAGAVLGVSSFLAGSSAPAAAQPGGAQPASPAASGGMHKLPGLPYAHDALEPHIDTKTMQLHHGKHHNAYVEKLNEAVAKHPQLGGMKLDEMLMQLGKLPEDVRTAVRNNGGGHANHSMFWSIMTPKGGGEPKGTAAQAIMQGFGALDAFKKRFNETGAKHFGAGWVFVTVKADGALDIVSRPNQDSPLFDGVRVLMGNDLWEHAYYLKYNNRRAEYLEAWWNVVNWDEIGRRFDAIRAGQPVV